MYTPNEKRYDKIEYRRCGKSGLKMSALSLGLWKNFGSKSHFDNMEKMVHTAFDCGICCFDLANCYGSPDNGAAEENFGRILDNGLRAYRDELCISTKAGFYMWSGPYGDKNGSAKNLTASLDGSLKRMGLEYVDIFYSHRPDPQTPIEETMGALADIVRQGKALYVGISNYTAGQTEKALAVLKEHRVPCLIHQARYSMLDRRIEPDLLPLLKQEGVGMIAFSPLAQGMLTDKYLNGIPDNSRAAKSTGHLQREQVTEEKINKVRQLNELAKQRGQTLAEMAIAWLLKDDRVTSVLVGASSVAQLIDNLKALQNTAFSAEEIQMIENILQ